jgi:hypothetical protein
MVFGEGGSAGACFLVENEAGEVLPKKLYGTHPTTVNAFSISPSPAPPMREVRWGLTEGTYLGVQALFRGLELVSGATVPGQVLLDLLLGSVCPLSTLEEAERIVLKTGAATLELGKKTEPGTLRALACPPLLTKAPKSALELQAALVLTSENDSETGSDGAGAAAIEALLSCARRLVGGPPG